MWHEVLIFPKAHYHFCNDLILENNADITSCHMLDVGHNSKIALSSYDLGHFKGKF